MPYPLGTRLPTQWPCWLESACAHLSPAAQVVRLSTGVDHAVLVEEGGARTETGDGVAGNRQGGTPDDTCLMVQGARDALTLPGALETGEPADLAWRDGDSANVLARTLARQPRPLDLPRLPLGSPTVEALKTAFRGHGWVRVHATHGSPCIVLNEGWTQPLRQFNPGRQSDLRRAHRRAEQTGTVHFEIHAPTAGPLVDRLMDEAFEVESRSWKGSSGTALAVDPLLGPFYRQLAQAAAQAGLLRLCFLRIAGRAAAMQLALEGEGRFWLMKIGYDAAYARCSPGQLLMLHTIGHAAGQGLASYEMLGNAATWTAEWTRTLRPFVRVRTYPVSWHGARALCADASRAAQARWRTWLAPRTHQDAPA